MWPKLFTAKPSHASNIITSLGAAHLRLGSKGITCSSQWLPQSICTGFKQFVNQSRPCRGSGEVKWMVRVAKALHRQGIPMRVKQKRHNSSLGHELLVIRCSERRTLVSWRGASFHWYMLLCPVNSPCMPPWRSLLTSLRRRRRRTNEEARKKST